MKKEHNIPTEIVLVDIERLIPYVNNARTHSEEQVAQIASSIKEFGWTNPVLIDGDKGIIAGHGRIMAARKLGMDKVPCIELSELSNTQRKAYILADNRIALNSSWNYDLLRNELSELDTEIDLSILGFGEKEIESIFNENFDLDVKESSGKEIDVDGFLLGHKCPRCGFEFDDKK